MRTRTTYLALLATLLTGTALTIVSCTPDATAPGATSVATIDPNATQNKVQQLREKYGWMGQYHTDGLSYIYTQLAKGAGKPRSKNEICRIVAKAAKEFHKKNRGREIPTTFVDPSLVNEVCGEEATPSSINKTVVSGFIDIHAPRTDLSYVATSYLDQLAALPISSTSRAQFLSAVYSIESQAAATLPESEAGAVTAVASIAISSANYWETNINSWVALGSAVAYTKVPNGKSGTDGLTPVYGWGPMARNMGKVIGADIVGGARVVATGWFLGPIAWDAAAVGALWASGVALVALM
jgi:hypothetical protein